METQERVLKILSLELNIPCVHISLRDNLRNDLGVDFIRAMGLHKALQDTMDITLSYSESSALVTVGDAVRLVESKMGDKL